MRTKMNRILDLNGRPYQIRKKWQDLNRRQKRWILADARKRYENMTSATGHPITNQEKRKLLHDVFRRIRNKGIWIPFSEVGRVLSSKIRKWNRRMSSKQLAAVSPITENRNDDSKDK